MKWKFLRLVSSNLINTILGGILGIFVARELGPHDKGILAIFSGTTTLISNFLNFGASHASAYYSRFRPGTLKLIVRYILLNLIFVVLLSFLLLFASKELISMLFLDGKRISQGLSVLMVIQIISSTLNISVGATLIAIGQVKAYGWGLNVGTLLTFLLTFIFFDFIFPSVEYTISGMIVGQLVTNAIFFYHLNRYANKNLKGKEQVTIKEFYSYGFKAYIGSIASLFFKRVDLFIIGYFLNVSSVGVYSIGLALRDLALIIPRALSGIMGGEVADKNIIIAKRLTLIKKSILSTLVICLAVTLGASIVFPILIPLLYGKAYEDSVGITNIIFLSLTPLSLAIVLGAAINSFGKPMVLSYCNTIAAGLSIIFMWFMTKYLNLHGAAYSTSFSSILLLSIIYIAYQRCLKVFS